MVKHPFFLITFLFVLTGCSTYNRIQTDKKNGLTILSLFQLPSVSHYQDKEALGENPPLKVNISYLYAQRDKAAPIITLGCEADQLTDVIPDSILTVTLEGEEIELPSLEGRYLIPENLWVPLMHANNIHYQMAGDHQELIIRLNTRERNKLADFLKKAMQLRDDIIPAIPEGQKKW